MDNLYEIIYGKNYILIEDNIFFNNDLIEFIKKQNEEFQIILLIFLLKSLRKNIGFEIKKKIIDFLKNEVFLSIIKNSKENKIKYDKLLKKYEKSQLIAAIYQIIYFF